MERPSQEGEILHSQLNRLIGELLRGTVSRHCFRPWRSICSWTSRTASCDRRRGAIYCADTGRRYSGILRTRVGLLRNSPNFWRRGGRGLSSAGRGSGRGRSRVRTPGLTLIDRLGQPAAHSRLSGFTLLSEIDPIFVIHPLMVNTTTACWLATTCPATAVGVAVSRRFSRSVWARSEATQLTWISVTTVESSSTGTRSTSGGCGQ